MAMIITFMIGIGNRLITYNPEHCAIRTWCTRVQRFGRGCGEPGRNFAIYESPSIQQPIKGGPVVLLTWFFIVTTLLSLAVSILGAISIIIPIQFARIRTRKAGFKLLLVGFIGFVVSVGLFESSLTPEERARYGPKKHRTLKDH